MPTEETRRIARDFIENLTTGRHREALGNFSAGAYWHLLGRTDEFSLARRYRVEELDQLMSVLAASVTRDHYVHIDSILAEGAHAAVEIRTGGRTPDGRAYDNRVAFMLDIRDGKIEYLREYLDTNHLKAITQGADPGPLQSFR
ncbi:nuclear transport factor 2 family protein [Nocardiopsis sp. B62]|uniref:nuclear transport factor 2 family protein n=1 Tax=Nocardiopsis sp. B62 TaxID=2824874 RepID=UPI001B385848|nr:nuclear transport factor 2 family protein [Nocardiopsis sp. B62]